MQNTKNGIPLFLHDNVVCNSFILIQANFYMDVLHHVVHFPPSTMKWAQQVLMIHLECHFPNIFSTSEW